MMNLLGYHTDPPAPFMESWGIHLDHCTRAMVTDNVVSSTVTDDWGWWDTGIRTDMCALTWIMCDSTRNVHNGFFNGGPAHTTMMANNVMDSTHLRGIVQNYGVLGQQGSPTNPTDIQWAGTFEAAHTDAYNTEPSQAFYRRDIAQGSTYWPTGFTPTAYPNLSTLLIDLDQANIGATSEYDCPIDFRANGYLYRVALDSINYNGPDSIETERLSKLELFRAVCADSILQLDSILVAYANSYMTTDIGRLDTLSRYISLEIPKSESGKLSSAVALVTPTDTIASLWKELLIIAFDKWTDDDTTTVLSNVDSTRLWDVGALCPYKFGPAVYLARTMLFSLDSTYLALRSECEQVVFIEPSERRGQDENENVHVEETVSAQVFPNPTHGILIVHLTGGNSGNYQLSIAGIDGRHIFTDVLTENQQTIDLSRLSSGLYIVKIMDDQGLTVFKDKISIVK